MASFVTDSETVDLSDGTTVKISKTPGTSAAEWAETKAYLEANPEEARRMESFSKDAKAMRGWMQQQSIQEFYQTRLGMGDEAVTNKLMGLETNPELAHIFEDIKRGGVQAAMQHYYNEPLMLKISRAMGGIPEEVKTVVTKIQSQAVTLQEACKLGDVKTVEEYLKAGGKELDGTDAKGITGLGYAIGANRTAVVKLLVEKKADPAACDTSGGTGLHYAAAYGRQELAEYLLSTGAKVNKANTQGQTPLALATKNKQAATIELLKKKGGKLEE